MTHLSPDLRTLRLLHEHGDQVLTVHRRDGGFAHVSASAERLSGWLPDDLCRRSLLDVVHPDDRERVRELLAHVASESRITYRLHCADGRWRWVDTKLDVMDSDADYLVGVTQDATREHQAIAMLEDGVRAMMACASDPIVVVQQQKVRYANAAAVALLGPCIGVGFADILHEEDRETALGAAERAAWTGGFSEDHDIRVLHQRGGEVETRASAIGVTLGMAPAAVVYLRTMHVARKVRERLQSHERFPAIVDVAVDEVSPDPRLFATAS